MELNELRILSPTAILGYGFPLASFQAGLARRPHVIAVDAGSTDPGGPYYLGSGQSFTQRSAVKRDLRYLIEAALDHKIPLIIGTAGGSGAKPPMWNGIWRSYKRYCKSWGASRNWQLFIVILILI